MSLGNIFSDAINYPLSDIPKLLIVGVLVLLSGLGTTVFPSFGIQEGVIYIIAIIIGLIFAIILSGYGVSVIKKGLQHSNEIPMVDFMPNLIDGIKVLIIGIVYMIIPTIITFVILLLFGLIGAELDHILSGLGIATILVFIIYLLFAIFEVIAIARFADTGEIGDALNIGAVIEDVKKIGIFNIIAFLIVFTLIACVFGIVAAILQFIPYIGVIIASVLLGGFIELFYNKAVGLLYAGA